MVQSNLSVLNVLHVVCFLYLSVCLSLFLLVYKFLWAKLPVLNPILFWFMRHLPVHLATVYNSQVVQKRQTGEVVVVSVDRQKSSYLPDWLEYS